MDHETRSPILRTLCVLAICLLLLPIYSSQYIACQMVTLPNYVPVDCICILSDLSIFNKKVGTINLVLIGFQ